MRSPKSSYALLLGILLLGLLLSYYFYSGPYYTFDDLNYITYAHQILAGSFTLSGQPYAFGYLVPYSIALSFSILGVNPLASIVPPILEYTGILVLVFLIGRELYSDMLGLLASFFVSIAPFVLGYTTRTLPDLFLALVATASIYVFVLACRSRSPRLYLLSGLVAGLAMFVKLSGLAFMLFFFLAAVMLTVFGENAKGGKKRAPIRNQVPHLGINRMQFLLLAIGLLAAFSINLVSIYLATGNPLYTLQSYGPFQNSISPSTPTKNVETILVDLFGYTNGTGTFFSSPQNPDLDPLGFMIFWALGGTIVGVVKRERRILYLSVIMWGIFLYFFFGTITLTGYTVAFITTRYFSLVAAPMALLASYLVLDLYFVFEIPFKRKAIVVPAALVAITVISNLPMYQTMYNYNLSIRGDTSAFYGVLSYISSNQSNSTVNVAFGDYDSAAFSSFLTGYGKNYNISYLDISHTNILISQMESLCNQSVHNRSFIAISYDNYSKSDFVIITAKWPYSECNLDRIGLFYYPEANLSTFNQSNTEINLYLISKNKSAG